MEMARDDDIRDLWNRLVGDGEIGDVESGWKSKGSHNAMAALQ